MIFRVQGFSGDRETGERSGGWDELTEGEMKKPNEHPLFFKLI